jgi:LPS sulfotransferase NodH
MATFDNAVIRRLARSGVGRRIRVGHFAVRFRRLLATRALARGLANASSTATRSPSLPPAPGTGPVRFVIVCEHRTGSNLLVTELHRRWPEIRMAGEAYGRRRMAGETTAHVTDRVFTSAPPDRIVGCKVMYGHVTWHELQQILRADGMRAIHLRRDNLLRRYVSLQIAGQTGYWIDTQEDRGPASDPPRVVIDIDRFLEASVLSLERSKQADRALAQVPSIEVWFEDVTADVDGELRRIGTFLGASDPVYEGSTTLRRQNAARLRDLVLNYDDLVAALTGTPMARFLD